ncbi:hypothetical protein GCM10022202_26540 [Microbacterium marinilacus]|uniref:HTH cro/C1-type domain-containing protein n=1 Tax=Microbacterium marinilacus TaxID=415209 RepID=A0ABP7BL32_9MICO
MRTARHERGISQEALAHDAGITKNAVQLIEAGRATGSETGRASNPRLSTVYGIADALGVEAQVLLGPSAEI